MRVTLANSAWTIHELTGTEMGHLLFALDLASRSGTTGRITCLNLYDDLHAATSAVVKVNGGENRYSNPLNIRIPQQYQQPETD